MGGCSRGHALSERALEELGHDVLHAVRLDLGEGPVLSRESGLGKAAAHDRRDAAFGHERGVQDEDLDVGTRLGET